MATKPEPRVTARVCALCGLDWKLHGKAPTADKCVELLLAEVRSLNSQLARRPYAMPLPYPVPYPAPYPKPWRPWPYGPIYAGSNSVSSSAQTWNTATSTPAASSTQPRAIAQHASC